MKKILLALAGFGIVLTGCKKDPEGGGPGAPEAREALIAIEGGTPGGVASVGIYSITNQVLNNNAYQKQNLNTLGSGLRDIMVDKEDNMVFFLLAGSEKIAVTDQKLELLANVENMQGIQQIIKAGTGKYYVSSWEEDGLVVLRGRNFNQADVILTGPGPTRMIKYQDLIFVTNTGEFGLDSTVTVIRSTADTIVTTLPTGVNPNSMVIDGENRLWILGSGEFNAQNPTLSGVGTLYRYHLDSLIMAIDSSETIQLDTAMYFNDNQLRPNNLTINKDGGGELYYIGGLPTGAIYKMNLSAKKVSEVPYLMGSFYGLRFDQTATDLYGLEAVGPDLNGTGSVKIYSPDGGVKNSFKIGVRPIDVEFR